MIFLTSGRECTKATTTLQCLVGVAAVLVVGCGGSSGGSGPAGPTPTIDPSARPTRVDTPGPTPTIAFGNIVTLFVRTSGDDTNDGSSPDSAMQTIGAALTAIGDARDRGDIIIGPGTYPAAILDIPPGNEEAPVALIGDFSGTRTGDLPGPVVITRDDPEPGSTIRVRNRQFVTIDGLTVRGAAGGNNAGIAVLTSTNVIVRNCVVSDSTEGADGINVITSNDVLVINNLVVRNARRGIRVAGSNGGSTRVRIINNTIANNGGPGVLIGNSTTGSEAELFFNIVQNNPPDAANATQILVTELAFDGYFGDTNLVFPERYNPPELPQEFDLAEDALFVDEEGGIYLLSDRNAGQEENSPAVDGGFEDVFPEDILDELDAIKSGTTSTSRIPDMGELDLGYHEPIPPTATPIPQPTPIPRATPRGR